ncbi:MAG: hypothetical protein ACLFRG_20590 [Desulfococcaceae bacterium]
MKTPRTLILLVGSNPLPNLLTARALRPERIALIHTNETKSMKNRLERILGKDFEIDPADSFLEDSNSADKVRRIVESLMSPPDGVHLNYTGGTKVMAAHALLAFRSAGGKSENASYLDEGGPEGKPRLRFDDGTVLPLIDFPELAISPDDVLSLHDIRPTPREAVEPAPSAEDARTILQAVFEDIDAKLRSSEWRSKRLHGERKRLEKAKKVKKAIEAPFRPEEFGLELSLPRVPDATDMDKSAFKHWYKFIGGEWLEEWVAEEIRTIGLEPEPNIMTGVNSKRGEEDRNLEIDIAVFRNFRTYFISCTTDATKDICKSKLFEIVVRSRHLGGDLARAALVCLADDKLVGLFRQDVADIWGASNTTKVFGLEDIRKWAGADGAPPNRQSLKNWLES